MNRPVYQLDKGKDICPFCHKIVYRGGINHWGRWYHRQCLRVQERSDLKPYIARQAEV